MPPGFAGEWYSMPLPARRLDPIAPHSIRGPGLSGGAEWRVAGDCRGCPIDAGLRLAWSSRNHGSWSGATNVSDIAVAREEFVTARRLGLPIALHVSGAVASRVFDSLCEQDCLGPDVQLVHFTNATMPDIRLAAQSGASVALTPVTELRVGYGITRLSDYLEGGMRVGLGIDSSALAGNASL